jgi:hypothetical protein
LEELGWQVAAFFIAEPDPLVVGGRIVEIDDPDDLVGHITPDQPLGQVEAAPIEEIESNRGGSKANVVRANDIRVEEDGSPVDPAREYLLLGVSDIEVHANRRFGRVVVRGGDPDNRQEDEEHRDPGGQDTINRKRPIPQHRAQPLAHRVERVGPFAILPMVLVRILIRRPVSPEFRCLALIREFLPLAVLAHPRSRFPVRRVSSRGHTTL